MGFLVSGRALGAAAQRVRLAAVLIAALAAAGCNTAGAPTASSIAERTLAFESIDGPPVGVFNRMVDNLSSEAQVRQVAVVSREGPAQYRVRGYLAAFVHGGRTSVAWVWDVYDSGRNRTLRIAGEEPGGRGGRDPWAVADEAMLRRIARASMDRLAAFLAAPDAAPDAVPVDGTAIAAAPDPIRRRASRASVATPASVALVAPAR